MVYCREIVSHFSQSGKRIFSDSDEDTRNVSSAKRTSGASTANPESPGQEADLLRNTSSAAVRTELPGQISEVGLAGKTTCMLDSSGTVADDNAEHSEVLATNSGAEKLSTKHATVRKLAAWYEWFDV